MATRLWRRDVLSWSLYDFANTIYSMNIVSLYLKRYIIEDLGYDDRYYDIPFALSMVLAAVLLPALGAMSDHATKKKLFLFLFTLTCCIAVMGLAAVPAGLILWIMILFVIANFSYEAAQPFYNALLYSVAEGRNARLVSGLGVAVGYLGSILGMAFVLPFVTGGLFGWEIGPFEAGGKQAAFVPTAVLFLAFTVPLMIWVRERTPTLPGPLNIRTGYRDVWNGLRQTRKYPGVLRFLIADYFFEDAVATVIINIGLYCSLVLRMPEDQITLFLMISTASAVAGSFLIGYIARHWSLKKMLYVIVWGWIISLVAMVSTDSMAIIWLLGSLIGIFLGGLWTTTRPMLGELVPESELGRFFGLFALSGRAAAIVGPLVWTFTVYQFRPSRPLGAGLADMLGIEGDAAWLPYKLGVLSLAFLMLVGLYIFRKVPDPAGGSDGT